MARTPYVHTPYVDSGIAGADVAMEGGLRTLLAGALIREIAAESPASGGAGGLSTPTVVDLDRDGKVDVADSGDLDGRLWRFDLVGASPAHYTATLRGSAVGGSPITTAPAVTPHPGGGRMVVFGSGSTLSPSSLGDTSPQWLVGVWDGAPPQSTEWLEQRVTEASKAGSRVRTASTDAPHWAPGGHRGWRLALPAGERLVADGMFIADGRLHVTTTHPTTGLADTARLSRTLINRQSDNPYLPTSQQAGPGVSGGHFDVDFFAASGGMVQRVAHVHEYDDRNHVDGVNMVAPSRDSLRLSTRLARETPFKVLVSNQHLNPASLLKVGPGSDFVAVREFGGQAAARDAQALLDSLPVYTMATGLTGAQPLTHLVWTVPLDAFEARDWWGDGDAPRAGLLPSQTSCVHDMDDNGDTSTGRVSSGERHNGALTVQLIASHTPASALRPNRSVDLNPRFGWTVREGSEFRRYVLAEYTFFWHHDNRKCYGQDGWTASPPQDPSSSASGETRAALSADPTDGVFGGSPARQVTSVVTAIVANRVVTTLTYSDGSVVTVQYTDRGDGTEQVTTTAGEIITVRARAAGGQTLTGPLQTRHPSVRVNWREVTGS